ncbi:MAG: nucleotidyltransferase family protein, partial [Candidatus Promineifilaceae bacterium]
MERQVNPDAFLWQVARNWRAPAEIAIPAGLDWGRALALARANKLGYLLWHCLSPAGAAGGLPASAWQALEAEAECMRATAAGYAAALSAYLELAAAAGLETVVIKGLALSLDIYGQQAMRPGGDIDLLTRAEQVGASLELLERLGNNRWYQLRDDRFYARHHLHQTRGRLDTRIWFEVHWALDHPYTLLT